MGTVDDPFNLSRFLSAQQGVYTRALGELRGGRKRSHWIWFIFPQIAGLGASAMSRHYAIASLGEAQAFAEHPLLGERLRACAEAMLDHHDLSAEEILGQLDGAKFRSCMTLFAVACPGQAVFTRALARFFVGERDALTLSLLERV
jgi:uncharacterized protein (DUF1810 family)